MDLAIDEKILKRALVCWGAVSQECIAIEECSEFIDVLMKFHRGRVRMDAVAEEVADVLIMMLQMRELIGPDLVDDFLKKKMSRLEKLIEESKDGRYN